MCERVKVLCFTQLYYTTNQIEYYLLMVNVFTFLSGKCRSYFILVVVSPIVVSIFIDSSTSPAITTLCPLIMTSYMPDYVNVLYVYGVP